jgi:hypothetical protein
MVASKNNTKSLSSSPITLHDKVLLVSPRTWLGVIQHMRQSPFVPFRVERLLQSVLGVLVPLLVLSLAKINPRVILPLSPWTFGAVQGGIAPVQQIAQTCHFWKAGRRDPLPHALDCLAERVASGRCRRFGRYDVFFPPPHNNSVIGQQQHAALFLPGALIAHTAYTEVAAKLSDTGICVVTVSMEPCRMATAHLGADSKRMKRIMKRVNKLLPVSPFWSIGGHSMGSFAAMRIAKELFPTNDDDDAATRIWRLFLWGSANFPDTRTNLRDDELMEDFPVLVIQGSNDVLCRMDAQQLAEFQNDFPADTTIYETIDGAAHNWFASVDQGDPFYVGKASISMNQQQEEAVALTADFLLNV